MMKISIKYCLVLAGISFVFLRSNAQDASPYVRNLLSRLTLEEKVRLLVGNGYVADEPSASARKRVPGAVGTTYPIARLHIPSVVLSDGPAGVRLDPVKINGSTSVRYATGFPIATLLASTWDTALVYKVGQAFGKEIKDFGIDVILAPALNIQRNPLNGRNFEYYSEDPVVSGNIAAAMVNGIQSEGVGTSIKHFVANNQETDRSNVNEIISERALREIYLKGFEIAIKKSHPWTVMNSYNKVNGIYTSENEDLNTTILRKEWGFKGLVMTDWGGGRHPVQQMIAGTDLLMSGRRWQLDTLLNAVKQDSLSLEIINRNVARVLEFILKSPVYKNQKYSGKPDVEENATVVRQAASEGMVLLKNENNALPLVGQKKIALFGNASFHTIANGLGSGEVHKLYTISIAQGLLNAGYDIDSSDAAGSADKAAMDNDIAVITIGRNSGETRDRRLNGDFTLKEEEMAQVKQVSAAFHSRGKEVVVILNVGGIIEMASWRDCVDGILLAWQPGQEAGDAIADILSGKVNPSGRLAITIPMVYEDEPSAQNFPGSTFPQQARNVIFNNSSTYREVDYKEGIFVGYRYFNTFKIHTAYPFGFGLSYTQFRFSDLKLNTPVMNNRIIVQLKITNTGKSPGKEVVQLYISAPPGKQQKPCEELKAFAKTRLLQPGESQIVSFPVGREQLASFVTERSSWVVEKGEYKISIGASSTDIKLESAISVPSEIIVEKTNPICYPDKEKAL